MAKKKRATPKTKQKVNKKKTPKTSAARRKPASRKKGRRPAAKRLQVSLLPNWAPDKNDDGTTFFYRTNSEDSGALQASLYAVYAGGEVPNPSLEDLVEMAQDHGEEHEAGRLVTVHSGACELGRFGSAVFRSTDFQHFQIWYLSNGRDFVLATYVSLDRPDAAELSEAQEIVGKLQLSR